MQNYGFNERASRVLFTAAEAARERGHEAVGTEHQLLGLLAEPDGIALDVLGALGADPAALAKRIDGMVGTGTASASAGMALPHTTRSKRVIELSIKAARELGHSYIGVEHLLLGLVREGSGPAAQVLAEAGVTDERVRAETLRLLEENIATTIIAMERAALDRWGRGDPSGFLEISAPDVVYFDPFQEVRLNGIDALRALYESIRGQVSVARYELIDPRVQASENMAVLTFNYVAEGSNEMTSRWNCTEVYRRDQDAWRIIQTHWSITRPGSASQ